MSKLTTTDIEVNSYSLLPGDSMVEGNHLIYVGDGSGGRIYQAVQPGIIRIISIGLDFGCLYGYKI